MEMLVRAVGAPAHQMGARVEAREWGALMARKRRWLARARFQEQQGERLDQGPPDLGAARRRVRSRKGNVFAPVTTINDEQGSPQIGEAMMHEFARQMERKHGRPAKISPDQGAGATDLDFPLGAWVKAVASTKPRAPGKSGMLTAAIKQLTTGSIASLQTAVRSTGAMPYIEPALRFVLHVPIRKRLVVRTEEDTRPIAMEEEIAKLIAILITAQTEQSVSDRQWAYQSGRSAGDEARMQTMLLDHVWEQRGDVVLYKRDRSNAYGTVDLSGIAFLLQTAGVDPPKARLYQRYVTWARIVTVTGSGTPRAWAFKVGVFQSSPLGPRVYLYQEVEYMAEVSPGRTDLPSVWSNGVEYAFDTERYTDDAVVPTATQSVLVETLERKDAIAPKYRVRHVPSKEEYLYIS